MPAPHLRTLTIDLDGTLLNTLPDLAAAANGMLRELRLPLHTEATVATFIGRGVTDLVTRCLPAEQSADATFLANALPIFRRHYTAENGRRTMLYPGVMEGLNAWKNAGIPMAVVTNKAAAFTEPLLAATGLSAFFQSRFIRRQPARKEAAPAAAIACLPTFWRSARRQSAYRGFQTRCRGRACCRLPRVACALWIQLRNPRAGGGLRCYSRHACRSRPAHDQGLIFPLIRRLASADFSQSPQRMKMTVYLVEHP
jgi:phosphoglycolate phosphatase-like HAD superfamily hydrolase